VFYNAAFPITTLVQFDFFSFCLKHVHHFQLGGITLNHVKLSCAGDINWLSCKERSYHSTSSFSSVHMAMRMGH